MFTVRMRAMAETAQNLQQLAGRLNQQIDEVEEIILRLRRISEYDEVRHVLRLHLENMQSVRYRLIELMAALNDIQRMYGLAERNITDYGDQVYQMNQNQDMQVVHLGSIRETIEVYHIR